MSCPIVKIELMKKWVYIRECKRWQDRGYMCIESQEYLKKKKRVKRVNLPGNKAGKANAKPFYIYKFKVLYMSVTVLQSSQILPIWIGPYVCNTCMYTWTSWNNNEVQQPKFRDSPCSHPFILTLFICTNILTFNRPFISTSWIIKSDSR